MFLIDEIQHLLSCGLRDQRAALNAIKCLANKLRISIVAAGTLAGYVALLPIKLSSASIDKRFVEYLLELSEGVTGRIIDVLRRAALQGIADKTQKLGLVQLQVVGAKMPSVVGQRAYSFLLGHPKSNIGHNEGKLTARSPYQTTALLKVCHQELADIVVGQYFDIRGRGISGRRKISGQACERDIHAAT